MLTIILAAVAMGLGVYAYMLWGRTDTSTIRAQASAALSGELSRASVVQLPTSKWGLWWYRKAAAANIRPLLVTPRTPGMVALGAAVVAGVLPVVIGRGILAPFAVAAALAVFATYLSRVASKNGAELVGQLPDLLSALRTHLGSGATPDLALRESANDLEAPLGPVMRELVASADETGASVVDILASLANRYPNRDLEFLVVNFRRAVDSGSDLRPQLEALSGIVEQRLQLQGKVRSAVASQKVQLYGVFGVGPAILVWQGLTNPNFTSLMLSPIGLAGLFGTGALWGVGVFICSKKLASIGKEVGE